MFLFSLYPFVYVNQGFSAGTSNILIIANPAAGKGKGEKAVLNSMLHL